MKRREFITLLGGAAAWPLTARAQQAPSPIRPLIGLLVPLSATAATRNVAAFQSALRDDGYVAGRNVTLELRYGEGALERLAPLVSELMALKPDVLFTGGKAGALAVHSVTQAIPIVIVTPEDPVVSGLANTIAKPGGNVTGTWLLGDDALVGKRLELLRRAVPALSRVGIVANPDDPSDGLTVAQLPTAAHTLGLTVEVFKNSRRKQARCPFRRGRARGRARAVRRPRPHIFFTGDHRNGRTLAAARHLRLSIFH